MIKKAFYISLIYTICFSLQSCNEKKRTNIIATNQSGSTILTNQLLEDWIQTNLLMKYKTKEEQIKLFFLEKHLLNKKNILDPDLVNRQDFISEYNNFKQAGQIIKKDMLSKINADDDKVSKLYKRLQTSNKVKKPKLRIYQIYKRYPPNINTSAKKQLFKQMQIIRTQVTNLDEFKSIASRASSSQTRLKQGLLGNISHGYFNGNLDKIIMKMKPGELSPIIKTQKGLLLFYCEKTIPARIKSDEDLLKKAKEYELRLKQEKIWEQYKTSQLNKIAPVFDWELIHSKESHFNDIAVRALSKQITKQELYWILNGMNNNKHLSLYSLDQIQASVNSYLLNKDAFKKLPLFERDKLLQNRKAERNKFILREVLSNLINKNFTIPNDEEILQYYLKNKASFVSPKLYNISLIGLKIDPSNKLESYQTTELVYHQLINGKLNFKQALKDYSMLDLLQNNATGFSLTNNTISRKFGLNLFKQIKLMKAGEISDVVESDDNNYLYIIKLNEVIKSRPADYKQAKEQAHQSLGKEMFQKIEQRVIKDILNSENINFLTRSVDQR